MYIHYSHMYMYIHLGEGEDDEDEEEETDSDESSSSEDESDEEGFDDSVCPPGCDPALFDQAVKMREQRLDVEEVLTGIMN